MRQHGQPADRRHDEDALRPEHVGDEDDCWMAAKDLRELAKLRRPTALLQQLAVKRWHSFIDFSEQSILP